MNQQNSPHRDAGSHGRGTSSDIERMWTIISLFVIVTITCIIFSPVVGHDFVYWDDDKYIIDNPSIHSLSMETTRQIFSSFFQGNYHPLTLLSFASEYHLFRLNSHIYHITNLTLHILNSMLVFWFMLKMAKKVLAAFIVGLLFAIHPLHVESVAWIAERKDVLYTLFFLGALISYRYYQEKSEKTLYYFLSLLLFVFPL